MLDLFSQNTFQKYSFLGIPCELISNCSHVMAFNFENLVHRHESSPKSNISKCLLNRHVVDLLSSALPSNYQKAIKVAAIFCRVAVNCCRESSLVSLKKGDAKIHSEQTLQDKKIVLILELGLELVSLIKLSSDLSAVNKASTCLFSCIDVLSYAKRNSFDESNTNDRLYCGVDLLLLSSIFKASGVIFALKSID